MNEQHMDDTDGPTSVDESSETSKGGLGEQLKDVSRHKQPGAPPGTMTRDPEASPVSIRILHYDQTELREDIVSEPEKLREFSRRPGVTWVNVDGLRDIEVIRQIGASFELHNLVLEDIVKPHQRPKVETYPEFLFLVARMPDTSDGFDTEQLSIVLTRHAVITFQEKPGDCLEPVRDRIRTGGGQIRSREADYLVYAILDAVVDNYFPVVHRIGARLNDVETQLMDRPSPDAIAVLQRMRSFLYLLRRDIMPHHDMLGKLIRSQHFDEKTTLYLRDCTDHVNQLVDATDSARELATDLRDYCFAEISFSQNETMRVLTVVASIFIPLSFVAGLYGMNFDHAESTWNMPELTWKYGYPMALGLMAVIACSSIAALAIFARLRRLARRKRNEQARVF